MIFSGRFFCYLSSFDVLAGFLRPLMMLVFLFHDCDIGRVDAAEELLVKE